jgi:aminopeptidase N
MRQIWSALAVVMVCGSMWGCKPGFGDSSESRLENAVKEGETNKGAGTAATVEEIRAKKCSSYRESLAKAKSEDLKEEDRLDSFAKLYADLKAKNEFLDNALAKNPDLQFQNDSEIPKNRDECVTALADVRNDYYSLVQDINSLLVVQDVSGKPAARVDLKKFKDAVAVLDPDDREAIFQNIEKANQKIIAAKTATP